jgi:hypothetical protein
MDWGAVVTIIVAVIFGIATIVLTLKVSRKKKPVWACITSKIIGLDTDAPAELKLFFAEKPVRDAYRTIFIFFNKGREPIRENDVAEDIVIHFKGADILQQPVILKPSKEAIKFSSKQIVKGGDNSIKLSFLYLDHNDGAVVEVLHTESQDITCSGTIIDTDRIGYIGEFLPPRPLEPRRLLREYGIAGLLGIVLLVILLVFVGHSPLMLAFFLLMGLSIGIPPLRRYIKFPKWSGIVGKKGAQRLS